ncbi:MAG: carboxypeptidase regulatory-like domain-containing protein [Terracidiphilus sp.]
MLDNLLFSPARFVCILTLLLVCLPALSQTVYRISGTVVNAVTGEPVPRAFAALLSSENRHTVASVACNSDGRFAFEGLPAGKYSLTASRRGYLMAFYNEHEQYSSAIVTGVGQQTEDLALRLNPEASIQVDVTDEAGDPVEKAAIHLFLRQHGYGVGERIISIANSTTGEDGSWHFYSLPPGDYFVAVTARPWYAMHGPATPVSAAEGKNVNPALDVAYPVTYFDSVTDEAAATPIVLAAGARERVSITLHPLPALHVYVPVPQGQENALPPPKLRQPIFGTAFTPEDMNIGIPALIENGTAEFVGLPPGHYELKQGNPPRIADLNAAASQQVLSTAGTPTASIHVTLRNANGSALPDKLQLALNWADPAHPRTRIVAACDKDEASFEAVPPGVYELLVLGDDENWLYPVASITADGQTQHKNRITAGDHPLSLTVTLKPSDTRVEGFARKSGKVKTGVPGDRSTVAGVEKSSNGLAGVMVVLVPNDPANHLDLFRLDQSDSDGSFALRGVAPGHYTLVAIEDGWGLEWARPEVIGRYLSGGIAVTVTERSGKLVRLSEAVPVLSR